MEQCKKRGASSSGRESVMVKRSKRDDDSVDEYKWTGEAAMYAGFEDITQREAVAAPLADPQYMWVLNAVHIADIPFGGDMHGDMRVYRTQVEADKAARMVKEGMLAKVVKKHYHGFSKYEDPRKDVVDNNDADNNDADNDDFIGPLNYYETIRRLCNKAVAWEMGVKVRVGLKTVNSAAAYRETERCVSMASCVCYNLADDQLDDFFGYIAQGRYCDDIRVTVHKAQVGGEINRTQLAQK